MKKISLLFFLFSTIVFSQERVEQFELKTDGFPDYVVIEFENKTDSEIFSQLKKWAEYNIRNAEYSNYSEVENEYLTYTINYTNAFVAKDVMATRTYDVLMDVEIRIKDNKLRVDLHPKEIKEKNGGELGISGGLVGILRKDGGQRKYQIYKDAFKGMNNLANRIVKDFENAVNGSTDYKKSEW